MIKNLLVIIKGLIRQTSKFFPYFFAFYIISLAISTFSETWSHFFNWKAFNISILFLGVISFISIFSRNETGNFKKLSILNSIKNTLANKKMTYVKILLIFLFLSYLIILQINLIDFSIIAFGLISIFLIKDGRVSAVLAMSTFIYCVFLYANDNIKLSETYSVYGYYFLIILVISQVMQSFKKTNPKGQIHIRVRPQRLTIRKKLEIKVRPVD
ncbi:MAG: hypothetical protein FJZ43_01815 [Candidatus Staskawiczbacteria bacterium]|nr:hypothetical protein [Candidatus Staskawiczbacteria bacterium]